MYGRESHRGVNGMRNKAKLGVLPYLREEHVKNCTSNAAELMGSQALSDVLPASIQLLSSTHLATLWSSYGHIYRLSVLQDSASTPTSLILKTVKPPVFQSADESHLRKLLSYRVERYFYSELASVISSPLNTAWRVAKFYPVTKRACDDSLLLEDLEVDFPVSPGDALGLDRTRTVLKWLANFHAAFWCLPNDLTVTLVPPPSEVRNPTEAQGAWAQGGYWYLDTRQEEYSCIWGEWKSHLSQFRTAAEKLKIDSRGRTLIHGDCKAANILFSADSSTCALYDFQYVGSGLGAQDVAYFIGTSIDGSLLRKKKGDEELLEFYYSELKQALNTKGVNVERENFTFEVLKEQFEVALVDWMRFMAGWGRWGNANWAETNVRRILKKWAAEGCTLCS